MAVKLAPLFTSPPGGGLNWLDISKPKLKILQQTLIFEGSGRREKAESFFWPRWYMNCVKGKRGGGLSPGTPDRSVYLQRITPS